jgi:UDP-4-amino-4,6-dideoxy-N-acetyl-beta-L-altrosamine N-acetyltransferase
MTDADRALVLAWRNHESVRAFMYTQHEISSQEHARWFERCCNDPGRHLLVYEEQGTPCGFVNFTVSDDSRNAVWGFYAAPHAPKGAGRRMGQTALGYAFGPSGFHKISGEALAHNEKSIRFHLSLGFHQEGVLRDHFFDSGQYYDVVCLGLLSSEWLRQPKNFTSQRQ